jgi:hypothetical protein
MVNQSNPIEIARRLNKLVFTLTFDNRLILEILLSDFVFKNQKSEESKPSITDSKESQEKPELEVEDKRSVSLPIFEE